MLRFAALAVGWTLAAPAFALTAPTQGPYSVPAGASTTLTASGVVMSNTCIGAQAAAPPTDPPPATGVQYRWRTSGGWSAWSASPSTSYDATAIDGPFSTSVELEVRCWTKNPVAPSGPWVADTGRTDPVVNVSNVAPSVLAVVTDADPGPLPHAQPVQFTAQVVDPEAADTVSVSWVFADGVILSGNPVSRSFNGPVTLTVNAIATDDDGGRGSLQRSVSVRNPGPTITAVNVPGQGAEGTPMTLSASATDPNGDPLTYTWHTGDGSVLTGASVSWTPRADGAYTVELHVTDGTSTAVASSGTSITNLAPTVVGIGAAARLVEGVSSRIEVEATDPGGDPLQVAWDFYGSGIGAFGAPGDLGIAWSWGDDGSYMVGVVVQDDDGAQATGSATLVVHNVAPVITRLDVDRSGVEAEELWFSATGSDVAADPLTYTWTFSDGATMVGPSVSHRLAEGRWTVQIVVDDDDGGSVTDTFEVVVGNAPPTLGPVVVPAGIGEGDEVELSVTALDPGGDPLTYTWHLGDGGVEVGRVVRHAWADDGTFPVTLVVDDGDGGIVSDTFDVVVANLPPVITSLPDPAAEEGRTFVVVAAVDDPGLHDSPVLRWFIDGVERGAGPSLSTSMPDDGTHELRVVADDGDGGQGERALTFTVANVAPTVSLSGDQGDGSAGAALHFHAQPTDPGADTFTWSWDFGDGAVATGGPQQAHAWAENGSYTVTVRVTDDDGGFGEATLGVVIDGYGPSVDPLQLPTGAREGSASTLRCVGVDAGGSGSLSYGWTFGDGGTATGAQVSHTWADDGRYNVACTVTDAEGRTASRGGEVIVENVAPTIGGVTPLVVIEGDTAIFLPTLVDPGVQDRHVWTTQGPAGATVDASTGRWTWPTTSHDVGEHEILLSVRDDDGAEGVRSWVLSVAIRDVDGDGLSDLWEAEVGLDPNDPGDAALDPDGDGRDGVDEYDLGTDPYVDDRPGIPALIEPSPDAEVHVFSPPLRAGAIVGRGRVTLSADLRLLDGPQGRVVQERVGLAVSGAGDVVWVPAPLDENQDYWWTARAADGFGVSGWAAPQRFVVNTREEAPPAPVLSAPSDGLTVPSLQPTLSWATVVDPDGDEVSYEVTVRTPNGQARAFVSGVHADSAFAAWTVDELLLDGEELCWSVVAVDDHGLRSPASSSWCFVVDPGNLPPSLPEILQPAADAVVTRADVLVEVRDGIDPEGRPTSLRWQLSLSPGFDTAELVEGEVTSGGGGRTTFTVPGLAEDRWHHLRVLSSDGAAESAWVELRFFLNDENEPPGVPTVVSPRDGAHVAPGAVLTVQTSSDPEGFPLVYEFEVHDDDGQRVAILRLIEPADDGTAWEVLPRLARGALTWRARAIDVEGLASDWSDAASFVLGAATGDSSRPLGATGDDPYAPRTGLPTACGCAGGGSPTGWGAVLALLLWRRRRA